MQQQDHEVEKITQRALFLCGKTEHEVVTSIESFRDFAAEVVKIVTPASDVTVVDQKTITVRLPGDDAVRSLALGRIFKSFNAWRAAADLRSFVFRMGTLLASDPLGKDDAPRTPLGRIVPLLKTRAYADGNAEVVRADCVKAGLDPDLHGKVRWETDCGLVAFAVANLADRFDFITADRLEGLGLDADSIHALAMDNLRAAHAALGDTGGYGEGTKEISGTDGFASSLVLLDEFLENEAAQAGDDLCLFSGEPGHLFLVPAGNTPFLGFMFDRISSGSLKLGDIPPLVYRDRRLSIVERASLVPVPGYGRTRH
jgi:hypothetical protein